MTTLTRSAQSLEYVLCTVATTDGDGAAVDITSDVVKMAFVPDGDPLADDTDFITADWETNDTDPAAPIYSARLLVGPGGDYEPVAGTRVDVYVAVTDNPEEPKIRAGSIRFQ